VQIVGKLMPSVAQNDEMGEITMAGERTGQYDPARQISCVGDVDAVGQ
jgi:hypothetical protein